MASRKDTKRLVISTHTPLARRDIIHVSRITMIYISTHTPLARRDRIPEKRGRIMCISTHTPHAGRDGAAMKPTNELKNFYSHAPCGARLLEECLEDIAKFISTHTPHAGRDWRFCASGLPAYISTHTPHAGRDIKSSGLVYAPSDFYSHAPCGARHELLSIPSW